jgi:hypothetical protein
VRRIRVERGEVRRAAEVRQQQETVFHVRGVHLRHVHPRGAQYFRDVQIRPHVFVRRRGVHRDPRDAARNDAEVTPEARVLGRRRQGKSRPAERAAQPGLKLRETGCFIH